MKKNSERSRASRIHESASIWYVSRWDLEYSPPVDFGSGKIRNCSMKAFELAQRVGVRVDKILGYNDEAAQFIEKDPIVYLTSMGLYLGLYHLLVLVTKGNFKSNFLV